MTVKSFAFKFWIALLTFIAGFVNVSALKIFSLPVSHHTGNISQLAIALTQNSINLSSSLLIMPLCFFFGAFISGLLFYQRNFALKKRYGLVLMCVSLILFLLPLFVKYKIITLAMLCISLGLQNGMFIYYGDILVRTTHITGYLTDAAFSLAVAIRGKSEKMRFFAFYCMHIFLFLLGGIAASCILISKLLHIASALYGIAGFYYFIFRIKVNKNNTPH